MILRDILTATINIMRFYRHDPGTTVPGEPNIHSGSFNNDEQFYIDVSFNTFCSIAKSRY